MQIDVFLLILLNLGISVPGILTKLLLCDLELDPGGSLSNDIMKSICSKYPMHKIKNQKEYQTLLFRKPTAMNWDRVNL